MSGSCLNHRNFMRAQALALRKEIEKDKKNLSKETDSEVRFDEAESHFMDFHVKDWAAGFRQGFCSSCPYRSTCGTQGIGDVDVADELSELRSGMQSGGFDRLQALAVLDAAIAKLAEVDIYGTPGGVQSN